MTKGESLGRPWNLSGLSSLVPISGSPVSHTTHHTPHTTQHLDPIISVSRLSQIRWNISDTKIVITRHYFSYTYTGLGNAVRSHRSHMCDTQAPSY